MSDFDKMTKVTLPRMRSIADSLPVNRRILGCMQYLVHGYNPWGVRMMDHRNVPSLSDCGEDVDHENWILCCGYWLTGLERKKLFFGKVIRRGREDGHGRDTMIAGENLGAFLSVAWERVTVGTEAIPDEEGV